MLTESPASAAVPRPAGSESQAYGSAASSDLTLIISSCDLFFDAWAPFFSLFWKRWPRCPYPIVLITNHLSLDSGPVRAMKLGADKGWASNLIRTLESLDTEFVYYMQEDQFLLDDVGQPAFAAALAAARDGQLDCLSFRAAKPVAGATKHPALPLHLPPPETAGATGGVFCDPCIWRRSALRSLLAEGETAWDFLKAGRARAADQRMRRAQWDIAALDRCPIQYMKRSGIREFLWHITALTMLRRERVPLRPMHRGVLLQSMHLRRALKKNKESRWLRAQYTGLGILSGLTRWQRARSMAHVKKHLASLGEAEIAVHALVLEYLRQQGLERPAWAEPTESSH